MPLTRNGKKFVLINLLPVRLSDNPRSCTSISVVDINGVTKYLNQDYSYNITSWNGYADSYSSSSSTVNRIYIGNGTSKFSEDDYKLSGDIIYSGVLNNQRSTPASQFTTKYVHAFYLAISNAPIGTIVVGGTNLSEDADLTISEIGLCYRPGAMTTPSASEGESYSNVLVFREVLTNPIIVAPGETWERKIKFSL